MKCGDCHRDILQKNPEMCPYCGSKNLLSDEQASDFDVREIEKLERVGRYEDAASKCEELGLMDRAEECRKKAETSHGGSAGKNVGRVSAISMECPYCGASQQLTSKSHDVACNRCGKKYVIPKRVLELL